MVCFISLLYTVSCEITPWPEHCVILPVWTQSWLVRNGCITTTAGSSGRGLPWRGPFPRSLVASASLQSRCYCSWNTGTGPVIKPLVTKVCDSAHSLSQCMCKWRSPRGCAAHPECTWIENMLPIIDRNGTQYWNCKFSCLFWYML